MEQSHSPSRHRTSAQPRQTYRVRAGRCCACPGTIARPAAPLSAAIDAYLMHCQPSSACKHQRKEWVNIHAAALRAISIYSGGLACSFPCSDAARSDGISPPQRPMRKEWAARHREIEAASMGHSFDVVKDMQDTMLSVRIPFEVSTSFGAIRSPHSALRR